MKIFTVILITFVSLFGNNKLTQAQSTQWVQRYNGTGNSGDFGNSIAVDDSGNVYVTGYSVGSGTSSDYATIKYNSSGVQKWIQRYNGPGNSNDEAKCIAVDDSGNVYVTGYSVGSGIYSDYATIKYNSTGIQKWIQRYNGPGNSTDEATSLAVDQLGNVYVTGYSHGSGIYSDYATIKYNSNGDSVWVKRYNGSANGYDGATSIAIDEFRNVYVTGISNESGSSTDIQTIKYNSNGVKMWDRKYNGTGNSTDGAYSIKVDNSGNVYVTGYSYNGTYPDYATVKYNSAGVQQWAQLYSGSLNGFDEAHSIAVDGLGNVYITGESQDSTGYNDFATIKYNTTGIQQWVQRYNGPTNNHDMGKSIACDSLGNVYVTGESRGVGTNRDYLTIKYNSLGIQQWDKWYNGTGNQGDYSTAIVIDRSGNVYVTGYSLGNGTSYDITTIKYSPQTITSLNLSALIEGFYSISTNKMIQDTVKVYIRNINSPYIIDDSTKSVLDSNGNGSFNLDAGEGNLYYVVVKHRNSIETWTKQGVLFTSTPMSYDFTIAASQAYGNNLFLKGSKYCIFGGDISQDGLIDGDDLAIIDNDAYSSLSGYVISDLNGDNFVDGTDLVIVDNNALKFVTIVRP